MKKRLVGEMEIPVYSYFCVFVDFILCARRVNNHKTFFGTQTKYFDYYFRWLNTTRKQPSFLKTENVCSHHLCECIFVFDEVFSLNRIEYEFLGRSNVCDELMNDLMYRTKL